MKVLFVYRSASTFVKKDYEILKRRYEIKEVYFKGVESIFDLWKGVRWCDITFSWFGKYPALFAVFLSKAFGKKSIVVAGGDDVAFVPEIDYGMLCRWWKKWCPLILFKLADRVIAVSEYTKKEAIQNIGIAPQNIYVVYHGFSSNRFRRFENIKKENIVITVAQIFKETRFRKGLETFVYSAKYLPNVHFYLVGRASPLKDGTIDFLKGIASDNVVFTGEIPEDKLIKLFNRAKAYIQLSLHEGFGCAIAEAMLCECIPIVTNCTAIPEVVGNCAYFVEYGDIFGLITCIRRALESSSNLGALVRKRIIEKFPMSLREEGLYRNIELLSRS